MTRFCTPSANPVMHFRNCPSMGSAYCALLSLKVKGADDVPVHVYKASIELTDEVFSDFGFACLGSEHSFRTCSCVFSTHVVLPSPRCSLRKTAVKLPPTPWHPPMVEPDIKMFEFSEQNAVIFGSKSICLRFQGVWEANLLIRILFGSF